MTDITPVSASPSPIWTPSESGISETTIYRYLRWLADTATVELPVDYAELWDWSVRDPEAFFASLWKFFGIKADGSDRPALADASMPGTWFPGVAVNYAEHALCAADDGAVAIIAHSQTRADHQLTWGQLRDQVARARQGFRRLGVTRGTRVAAYLPNIPETVVAFLAAASLGAVWSSCPPEFGTVAVLDRLSQIEPEILLAADGYRYGDRIIDRRAEVADITAGLGSLTAVVAVAYLYPLDDITQSEPRTVGWERFIAESGELAFDRVPFTHPLYVLYSSGTTGRPKPIMHGHGGMLLHHLKDAGLQLDIRSGDTFMWFTTTGWMMWNFMLSALLVDATVVLFDGDPGYPDRRILWQYAEQDRITYLGVSPSFVLGCAADGIMPKEEFRLPALRVLGSTGAPLSAQAAHWIRDSLPPHVQPASISGGTDVCSILVGSSPLSPVWAGEISCRALGVNVQVFDPHGQAVTEQEGEMVVASPLPAMPVGFWSDEGGIRYNAAYFERYPGVWHQGDWISITERGSCVISGRSDATLNRGGVRIGTGELYGVVDSLSWVVASLAVHLEDGENGGGKILLFVQTRDGVPLSDAQRRSIRRTIHSRLSPRHVPDVIEDVPEVPVTLSGKKLEIPVKGILLGESPSRVADPVALRSPDSLSFFVNWRRQADFERSRVKSAGTIRSN